jgi:hypothetical protein
MWYGENTDHRLGNKKRSLPQASSLVAIMLSYASGLANWLSKRGPQAKTLAAVNVVHHMCLPHAN